eukprot:TRINITY_DN4469_c3_g1_i1.p1 TRINITY_DN4469_c3_g1~~TRINITY_DN4469_c3_g1_i1.p1  ORF type:complete len:567 (+),score=172.92 TRINITY_DN4469_c3_g1_i1:111-1811(+)
MNNVEKDVDGSGSEPKENDDDDEDEAEMAALERMRMKFGSQPTDFLDIHESIGEGTFSMVYRCTSKKFPEEEYCVKILNRGTGPSRILNEAKHLMNIGGTNNVPKLLRAFRKGDRVSFLLPYLRNTPFKEEFLTYSPRQVRLYMYNLFIALSHVHACGVIHRDVKPANFLANMEKEEFLLIDFGLAETAPDRRMRFVEARMNAAPRCSPMDAVDEEGKDGKAKTLVDEYERNKREPKSKVVKRMEDETVGGGCEAESGMGEIASKKKKRKVSNDRKHMGGLSVEISRSIHSSTSKSGKSVHLRPFDMSPVSSGTSLHSPVLPSTPVRSTVISSPPASMSPAPSPFAGSLTSRHRLGIQKITGGTHAIISGRTMEKARAGQSLMHHTSVKDRTPLLEKGTLHQSIREQNAKVDHIPDCRPVLDAHRQGTRGFRAPEVLLKYGRQTQAIDVWGAGVILLCIASGRYPFFKATDDLCNLAEIHSILGTDALAMAANEIGKEIVCSESIPRPDLKRLILDLRRSLRGCGLTNEDVTDDLIDLLKACLDPNPLTRITAKKALEHPFFDPIR